MNRSLFVYGSLELPELMSAVAGAGFAGRPAVLEGYERRMLRGRPYPAIRRRAGSAVDGVLYTGLTPSAWRRLGRYEEACYQLVAVEVADAQGKRCRTLTYALKPQCYGRLGKRPWDRERFRSRWLSMYLGRVRRKRAAG